MKKINSIPARTSRQVQSYLKCHVKKYSAFSFYCQFDSRYQSKCDNCVWASIVHDARLSIYPFSTCWPAFVASHKISHIFRISSINNSLQYFIHPETKPVSLTANIDPLPSPKINDYFELFFFLMLALDGSKSATLNISCNVDKYTESSEAGERLSL